MNDKSEPIKANVEFVENGHFDRSWRDEKWGDRNLSVAAQDTSHDEKSMTTWQAIKASKKAIMWSLIISTCVIMEGYDTNLLGNFYAYRSYNAFLDLKRRVACC